MRWWTMAGGGKNCSSISPTVSTAKPAMFWTRTRSLSGRSQATPGDQSIRGCNSSHAAAGGHCHLLGRGRGGRFSSRGREAKHDREGGAASLCLLQVHDGEREREQHGCAAL